MVRNLLMGGSLLLPLMILARGQPWAPLAGLLLLLVALCSLLYAREVGAGRARVSHLQIFALLFMTILLNGWSIPDREWGICLICLGLGQFLAALMANGLLDGLDPVAGVALPLSGLLAGLRWQMAQVTPWQAVALGWAPFLTLALLTWPIARALHAIPYVNRDQRRRLWFLGMGLSLAVNLSCLFA